MNGNNKNFDNKNIEKSDFYNKDKKIFNIDVIDVNKILVSKKERYGKYNPFKYFIGYNDNDVIIPLYSFISQTTGYINIFEKNKIMPLMAENKQVLENYKKIWKKIKKLMGIDFESKATYNDKYINKKIKTYKDSITINCYNKTGFKEVPEEKVPHKCLSIIFLDCVLYAYEKYYPQTFLEEWKNMRENVKTKNYIDMELKSDRDSDSGNGIYIDIVIITNKQTKFFNVIKPNSIR